MTTLRAWIVTSWIALPGVMLVEHARRAVSALASSYPALSLSCSLNGRRVRRYGGRYGWNHEMRPPACNCTIDPKGPFGKYCSEHCKQAGDKTELRCDCQHAPCR